MFRRTSDPTIHDLGRVVIGLGFVLMAFHLLLNLMTRYEGAQGLTAVLHGIAATPILSVLLAAVVTWAAHSSVAVVLIIVSMVAQGLLPPDQAFTLVLGAIWGTALYPLLEGHAAAISPSGDFRSAISLAASWELKQL